MKNISTGTGIALLAGAIVAYPIIDRVMPRLLGQWGDLGWCQALDSQSIRDGLKEILLGPGRLYEALRG